MSKVDVKVKGIVRDGESYLIVKQDSTDGTQNPYQWQFVDGAINEREDPAKAVVRIIKEKTGLDTVMDRVLYTWSYVTNETFTIGICYECFALHTDSVLSKELLDAVWVPKEEFSKYITNEAMLRDLENSNLEDKWIAEC